MLELTESEYAPWTIVEATSQVVGPRRRSSRPSSPPWSTGSATSAPPRDASAGGRRPRTPICAPPWSRWSRRGGLLMLETLDLTRSLAREPVRRARSRGGRSSFANSAWQVYLQKRPVVIAFEGWDAAGKGGAIKRITEKIDPRGYVVYPISAPQGEDKTRHYLYRFWRRLPERGQIAIFDRSWYGRVLVERVEGFAAEAGVEAGVQGDQLLRAPVARLRHDSREVLDPDLARRAAAPLRGAQAHRLQGLEADRRGLAQPGEMAASTRKPSRRCC